MADYSNYMNVINVTKEINGTVVTEPYGIEALRLTTNAGDATHPVYFENGIPVQCDGSTGGGGGGSNVTITPLISSGNKIANYTIDGKSGSLYTSKVENAYRKVTLWTGDIKDINDTGRLYVPFTSYDFLFVHGHPSTAPTENHIEIVDRLSLEAGYSANNAVFSCCYLGSVYTKVKFDEGSTQNFKIIEKGALPGAASDSISLDYEITKIEGVIFGMTESSLEGSGGSALESLWEGAISDVSEDTYSLLKPLTGYQFLYIHGYANDDISEEHICIASCDALQTAIEAEKGYFTCDLFDALTITLLFTSVSNFEVASVNNVGNLKFVINKIEGVTIGLNAPSTVIPNPVDTPTDDLISIKIDDVTYSISGGGGGGGDYVTAGAVPDSVLGNRSTAEGYYVLSQSPQSHAEGYFTSAGVINQSSPGTHVEGYETWADGEGAHSEGTWSTASYSGHAEGSHSYAYGHGAHAEGLNSTCYMGGHAEGLSTCVYGNDTFYGGHAEGWLTTAINAATHAEGRQTIAGSLNSLNSQWGAHAEGQNTTAVEAAAHAEGQNTYAFGQCHAEGNYTKAGNSFLEFSSDACGCHSEGEYTTAYGRGSHTEGYCTSTSGEYAHAEGRGYNIVTSQETITYPVLAYGNGSHAEGYATTAYGVYSHTEGFKTSTNYYGDHAEGYQSSAGGYGSGDHAEGYHTYAFDGDGVHAEGTYTTAFWDGAHAEGSHTCAAGQCHAEGWSTIAGSFDGTKAIGCHAEGVLTIANNKYAHAEGYHTRAYGKSAHAQGYLTTAYGQGSHSEGYQTYAYNVAAHAEGENTSALGLYAHSEGYKTTAQGSYSHTEGYVTYANTYSHSEGEQTYALGDHNHVEGYYSSANNSTTHAEGYKTNAISNYSHSEGFMTSTTNTASHALGHYNAAMTTGGTVGDIVGTAFVIGNGINTANPSNAFTVEFDGSVSSLSSNNGTSSDYAEYFEWADNNINDEDRTGYFVTFDNKKKIRIANSNDKYILGIVSGEPFVVGNSDCSTWNGMYLKDEFGRKITEPAPLYQVNLETGELEPVLNENNEQVYQGFRFKINPEYDSSQEYIKRRDRAEWSPVGMLGVLSVYDDGTCIENDYCKVADNGIATRADNEDTKNIYRVLNRKTENIIEILFR